MQHGLKEQADSCFAKIVEGQDVVRQIHLLPTHKRGQKYGYFFEEPVQIVSARIMESPPPQQTEEQKHQAAANLLLNNIKKKIPRNPRPNAEAEFEQAETMEGEAEQSKPPDVIL